MEANNGNAKRRKTIVAVIAVVSVVVVIFLFIFSLYHLPTRNPVETPEWNENAEVVESPEQDFATTNDIMNSSQEEVGQMLGNLEMQYENAKVNNEPYEAQQAGMRLALAYDKAGEPQQARELINSLMQTYSYDSIFVSKCHEFLRSIDTPSK